MKKFMTIFIILLFTTFLFAYNNPDLKTRKSRGCRYPDIENIGNRDINGRIYLLFPNFISFKKEIQIGAMLAAEVEKNVKLLNNEEVLDYVNGIVQNISRHSDARVPFSVKIIDTDEINAFALPGGFVFVNKGLIEAADTECELAGVIAHETGHVAARHATERLTKMQLLQWAAIPSIFVGGAGGIALRNGVGFALNLKLLGITRGSEKEADILGVEYTWNAGYDPYGFISFFEKMLAREKKQPGKFASWFRTHPSTPDRISYVKKEIENCLPEREKYIVNTSKFLEIKSKLLAYDNVLKVKNRGKKTPTLKTRTKSSSGGGKKRPTLKKLDDND